MGEFASVNAGSAPIVGSTNKPASNCGGLWTIEKQRF